jgi:hypothetical protein
MTSEMSDTKTVTPVYLFYIGEMIIDASVEEVWRHAVDYPSWQNYSLVQHLSGTAGQEGEVVLLKKEETSGTTPYLARTIKLEPGRRIIWKTYREDSADFGIVEFAVEPVGSQSRFSYNTLYERNLVGQTTDEIEAFRARAEESASAVFAVVLAKLKALAETSSP